MHKLNSTLKLVRWPNLVMTGAGIISIWYFLIYGTHPSNNLEVDFRGIIMLSISIIFIMGAGYIVNDIFDEKIDGINKPSNQIIGVHYSIKQGWRAYFILNLFGIAMSIFAAILYRKTSLLLFLPIGVMALFAYSKWLKKRAPWGNLLISVLCALVLWMPAFGEWELVSADNELIYKFFSCSLIAGTCMLMREIVKSQQDFKGDMLYHARTLPVILGMSKVHQLMGVLNFLAIAILVAIIYYFSISALLTLLVLFTMVFPLIAMQLVSIFRPNALPYTLQSKILKIIMASGMIILPWALSNFRS